MNILLGIYVFIVGAVIGSFLNVCIYRIPNGESIAYPPSHCTTCGSKIRYYDLIPIISWFILKGKCRNCGEKISFRYPLIELSTGAMFVFTYMKHGYSLETIKFIILIAFLIVIGMIDFDTTDVYSITTWSGIVVGIVFIVLYYFLGLPIKTYLIGGAIAFGLISLIILITNGMGWGDAEICLLCGLFLGLYKSILLLLLSFIIGAIIGITLILLKKKSRKDHIPFGPSIVIACFIVNLFGDKIFNLYLKLIMN